MSGGLWFNPQGLAKMVPAAVTQKLFSFLTYPPPLAPAAVCAVRGALPDSPGSLASGLRAIKPLVCDGLQQKQLVATEILAKAEKQQGSCPHEGLSPRTLHWGWGS